MCGWCVGGSEVSCDWRVSAAEDPTPTNHPSLHCVCSPGVENGTMSKTIRHCCYIVTCCGFDVDVSSQQQQLPKSNNNFSWPTLSLPHQHPHATEAFTLPVRQTIITQSFRSPCRIPLSSKGICTANHLHHSWFPKFFCRIEQMCHHCKLCLELNECKYSQKLNINFI